MRDDCQCMPARRWVPYVVAALLAAGTTASADRWSLTPFTTSRGLPSDAVTSAVEDRHGFLWFGTGEGLSRFDGQGFRNFGIAEGLDDPHVSDVLATPDGFLWVGTADGVYRFDPAPGAGFSRLPSPHGGARWSTNVLFRDRRGTIWCGGLGLYYAEERHGSWRIVQKELPGRAPPEVFALLQDREDALWIGSHELLRLAPDGSVQRIVLPDPPNGVASLIQDRTGRILVGTARGLFVLDRQVMPGEPPRYALRPLPARHPIRHWVERILETRDGTLWIGTRTGGIAVVDPRGTSVGFMDAGPGVPVSASPLLEDRAGSVWLRTPARGLLRRASEGFVLYGSREGLVSLDISSIVRSRSGELVVAAKPRALHKLVGDRFVAVRPRLPPLFLPGWGSGQYELQDRDGRWWIPTGEGLFRFPPVGRLEDLARVGPERRFTEADGLAGRDVFRLFEDSRGDVWISTLDPKAQNLTQWERGADRFRRYGEPDGLPASSAPSAFVEDRPGHLWIGHYAGHLSRRRGGRFEAISVPGAMARSSVRHLLLDRRGRIWIATTRGLFRCDRPGDDRPLIASVGAEVGLSSVGVRWIEEDASGLMYAATSGGIERFDPETGRVWHFTTAQGPALSAMLVGMLDHDGAVWLGGMEGLARFQPAPARTTPAGTTVRIDGVRVAGRPLELAATGVDEVAGLVLGATERQMEIVWVGIDLSAAEPPLFEYRLRESDVWGPPTEQRRVALSALAPGRYRFQVRAVAGGGGPARAPAVVAFEVRAPFWRTWWFLSSAVLLAAGAGWTLYRQRVVRLLALQQQRARIAMDLHDELGSGLGSIGLLADLATDPSLDVAERQRLTREIGDTASELGTSLSDIVASLQPGAATMESLGWLLATRARRLFPGTEATLTIRLPESWPSLSLPLPLHRNVVLIALEALHNAARHSSATGVTLSLEPEGRLWRLEVEDDGRGIEHEPEGRAAEGGLGLDSMRRRAGAIGARLECESRPEGGTRVRLVFSPAGRPRGPRWLRL
jgi:ligand-binding sensor domain-containing protein/signal transduction histidine kinase